MDRVTFVTLLLLVFITNTSYAAKRIEGPIKGNVLKVLDGDTLEVRMDVWLNQQIETKLRIIGIDTPEIKGKCPFEREKAQEAKKEIIRLINDNFVTIYNIRYGKYAGRVIADVKTADGINLANYMLEKGLARSYKGKKRKSWCG